MDGLTVKNGRLVNERPNGVTGIQQAADIKKTMKRAKKISMIADAINLADARKDFIQLTEAVLAVQGNDPVLKALGQKYLDESEDIMNVNVNPGLVDNTIVYRDEDHIKEIRG